MNKRLLDITKYKLMLCWNTLACARGGESCYIAPANAPFKKRLSGFVLFCGICLRSPPSGKVLRAPVLPRLTFLTSYKVCCRTFKETHYGLIFIWEAALRFAVLLKIFLLHHQVQFYFISSHLH